ncbi:MAG: hemerythrin family protein [Rhodospirillaceae bacterium]
MADPHTAAAELRLIEEDHLLFRRLAERLQETVSAHRPADEIAGRQAALLAHLDAHMGYEERLMLERGYPLAFSHAQDHKAFRDQIDVVLDGLKSGTITPTNLDKLLLRVHDHHIKNQDSLFSGYLLDRYSLQEVAEGGGI